MTWTTFHRRGEVLRTVIDAADARRDGLLPMDVPGVPETFGDELSLLGALQLRWHTRLSGRLDHRHRVVPLRQRAARGRGRGGIDGQVLHGHGDRPGHRVRNRERRGFIGHFGEKPGKV